MPLVLLLLVVIFGSVVAALMPVLVGGLSILGAAGRAAADLPRPGREHLRRQRRLAARTRPGHRLRPVHGRPVPRGTRRRPRHRRGRAPHRRHRRPDRRLLGDAAGDRPGRADGVPARLPQGRRLRRHVRRGHRRHRVADPAAGAARRARSPHRQAVRAVAAGPDRQSRAALAQPRRRHRDEAARAVRRADRRRAARARRARSSTSSSVPPTRSSCRPATPAGRPSRPSPAPSRPPATPSPPSCCGARRWTRPRSASSSPTPARSPSDVHPVGAKGDVYVFNGNLPGDPLGDQAKDAVTDLRALPHPAGTEVLVGGFTAKLADSTQSIFDRLPLDGRHPRRRHPAADVPGLRLRAAAGQGRGDEHAEPVRHLRRADLRLPGRARRRAARRHRRSPCRSASWC